MNPSSILSIASHWSTFVTMLLVASIWQGLALGIVTALCLRALLRFSSRLRYRVLFAGYISCVLLPFASTCANLERGTGSSAPHHFIAPLVTLNTSWTLLCTALWVGASLFAAARLGAGFWSIRCLRRSSISAPPAQLLGFQSLLQPPGRLPVPVKICPGLRAPVTVGYKHPTILMPGLLLQTLTAEQMEQVLLHELEHIARRDNWVALLTALLRCLLPLHPALFWFERQLLVTREMACDDAVLLTASPRAYAAKLTRIAESALFPGHSVALHLVGSSSQLIDRIDHILSSHANHRVGARGALPVSILVLASASMVLTQYQVPIAFSTPPMQAPATASASRPFPISAPQAKLARLADFSESPLARAHRPSLRHKFVGHHSTQSSLPAVQLVLHAFEPSLQIHEHSSASARLTAMLAANGLQPATFPVLFTVHCEGAEGPLLVTLVVRSLAMDPGHLPAGERDSFWLAI